MNIFNKLFKKTKPPGSDDLVFTHNCAARICCGRLEQTPSMMALGSTLGTTVDGNHKGAGITKMQGQISRVQYYFENQSWISNTYFKYRGLNEKGYLDNETIKVEDIDLSGDIELENSNDKTVIDFDDQHAEIDKRKDQRFSEV